MKMATRTEVSSPHGVKRHGDDSLDSEQRLAKRFNLLNINRESKLYIPVSTDQPAKAAKSSQPDNDLMQVEDTKDKIFIYDLDAELAESDPEEDRLVFIPDIEKHLTKIPKHVLTGQDEDTKKENQLVLYQVPTALSVPEDEDSVRKAIIETRTRAQQRQEKLHQELTSDGVDSRHEAVQPSSGPSQTMSEIVMDEDDMDAMDIE